MRPATGAELLAALNDPSTAGQLRGLRARSPSKRGAIIATIVIGLIVASGHAFFVHLNAVMPILSAILAVLLWPLVLLGVDLHLR